MQTRNAKDAGFHHCVVKPASRIPRPLRNCLNINPLFLWHEIGNIKTRHRSRSHLREKSMKFVSAILTFLVIAFVIMMAIPVVTAGLALLLVFSGFFIWLLPILLILGSEKT